MPGNIEKYYRSRIGNLFVNPLEVKVRATVSNSGATVTVSSTRRQSHPGAAITGDTGSYTLTGLPTGVDYHIVGLQIVPPTGTQLVCIANVLSFDTAAGSLVFKTRRSDTGAEADPADGTIVHMTIQVEEG